MSWFFKSSPNYSPLPTCEYEPSDYAKKAFSFDSAFKFEERNNGKNFKSVFNFTKSRNTMEADYFKVILDIYCLPRMITRHIINKLTSADMQLAAYT